MSDQAEMAQRVARQFLAGIQLDEKMRALLLKLRKGADSTLSLGILLKVLALLGGWRVEEIVGIAQLHYDTHNYHLRNEDEAAARATYDRLKALEISELPTQPRLGEFYIMNLSPFAANRFKEHGAEYKLWVGVPGYRFTDPEGKVFELLPDRHDFSRGQSGNEQDRGLPAFDAKALKKSLRLGDLLRWMREHTTYFAQINAALGMEEHVPADQRTRDNTGTCGVCFRNIKIVRKGEETFMAIHGYNRPGHGYIVGRCPGGDHAPYELSSEATKTVLATAIVRLAAAEDYLAKLGDPNLQEFNANAGEMGAPIKLVSRSDPHWEVLLSRHAEKVKRDVAYAKVEKDIYAWLVEHWKIHPLPKEGEREVDFWTMAVKATRD